MLQATIPAAVLNQNIDKQAQQVALRQSHMMDLRKPQAMTAEQMKELAEDFESMFLSQMLAQMFGDSVGDSLFGDKNSKDVYKDLIVEEYSKHITNAGGIGVADYVQRELLAIQEAQHA